MQHAHTASLITPFVPPLCVLFSLQEMLDEYKGDTVGHGIPHGEGELTTARGAKITGPFHDGAAHGVVKVIEKNGDVYEGCMVGGVRETRDASGQSRISSGEWNSNSNRVEFPVVPNSCRPNQMRQKHKIAIVGYGRIGQCLSSKLLEQGHTIVVYDSNMGPHTIQTIMKKQHEEKNWLNFPSACVLLSLSCIQVQVRLN